jgi:NADH dehydrogenase/NADH:ubiquinone oxidoreductase subunit G
MAENQEMVMLTVDGRRIEAAEGAVLLEACLENDIFVPNLCFLKASEAARASCRMCFVAVEGKPDPVPACTTAVAEGMVVHTDTPAVRRLQRAALKLLLSVHDIDCKNCPANKRCELQRLARFLKTGLNAKPLETRLKAVAVDDSHPYLVHYPNRCVLCGKCIAVCAGKGHHAALTFAKRGLETVVSAYGQQAEGLSCPTCGACADICPVGALALKDVNETMGEA